MSAESRWLQVEALLDRALDLPEAERSAFLGSACGGDPELAGEVRALLAAAARASALDRPAAELAPTLAEAAISAHDRTSAPGERLGAYRLIRLLGEGGMGRVYLAERADGQFERQVALKILASTLGGEAALGRFRRERQILADLRHENIAQLLDAGVAADGRPWFALEYVNGLPITEHASTLALGRDERIALHLQACDALAHAHRQGIVHRDLKPSNLLVGDSPDGGFRLYVLDFGIARAAGVVDLTATGDILGTPGFMSPEQARGELESIDRRTDVFALGVVLFELLCGRRPFAGATPGEVLGAILAAEPPNPRTLVPDLPRDLDTILLACLEKSPNRRYPSAQALAEDLRRYLAGDPIAARAPGLARRVRHTARRHPLAVATSATLIVSALVGLGVWARGVKSARVQSELSRRYGAIAEQISAEIRHEHLAPLHDTSAARDRLTARLVALEGEMATIAAPLRAAGLTALGRGQFALGDTDGALRDLEAAWSAGLRTPDTAVALAEAEVQRYANDRAAAEAIPDPTLRESTLAAIAERSRDRALELAAIARSTGNSASSDLVEARIAFLEGDLDRAASLAAAASATVAWLYESHLLTGEIELARASAARRAGATAALESHIEAAIGAFRSASVIGASDPATHLRLCAAATSGIDLILHAIDGDPDALAETGLRACRFAAIADPQASSIPEQESALATVYARELSRRDRDPFPAIAAAAAAAERAIALANGSPTAHRRLGDALTFRAEFERERGQDSAAATGAAILNLEQATALAPNDAGVWNSLGLARWEELLRAQERAEEYLQPARAAAAAFARAVELEPRYAYAWGNLGTMRNKLGEAAAATHDDPIPEFEKAREAFERSLEIYPEYSTAVNNLGNVFHNLGETKLARGEDPRSDYAQALEQFDRAAALKPDWFVPRFGQARSSLALAWARAAAGESPDTEIGRALDALGTALQLRNSLVQGHELAGEIHMFRAEHARRSGTSPRAALRDARRSLERVRELDPAGGAELATGLDTFERGLPSKFYPPARG